MIVLFFIALSKVITLTIVVALRGDSEKITPLRAQKSDKYRDSWKSDNYTESNKEKNKQSTKLIKKMKQRG